MARPPEDLKIAILTRIGELKLPLQVFSSKSGGLHSVVFFDKPVPCEAARTLLRKWAAELGDPNAEIFPKPVANGKLPFGIALPFFGEPERFKSFKRKLYQLPTNGDVPTQIPDYLRTDTPEGFENVTPDDLLTYGVKLPEGFNFEAELNKHKLQFVKRPERGGISYDYHNYHGQPCLLAGVVHKNNERNIRCSRFFEKDGYIVHNCFDDDGLPPEEKGRTRKTLGVLGIKFDTTPAVVPAEKIATAEVLELPDMPESVLDGRLGELCQKRLKDFPIALGWPALMTVAGSLVRPSMSLVRANLYTALVGPVGVGKTQAIERANHLMDIRTPILQTVKAGSAEGLLAKLGDQNGKRVLLFPDELSHLLEKAQITNASFSYILTSLFYRDEEDLTIFRGKQVKFNCRLSLIGGLIDKKFEDSFSTATTGGLYDRFLFGQCPSGFQYLWRPVAGQPAFTEELDECPIDGTVWEARDNLKTEEKINPRVLEIVLRCASICAAFDGRNELRAADLGPAWELARYQTRVRLLLQPNTGRNFEAQITLKILNYLNQNAPDGKWLLLRDVLRATHAYEYGPSIVERALSAMTFGGSIEQTDQKVASGPKRRHLRLSGEGNV